MTLYKINDIERSMFEVTPRVHWFRKVLLYLNNRPVSMIAPPFIIGFLATENLPKVKLVQVEISSNIAQKSLIIVSRKSYLVITCPNSYEKFTKSEIRSSWSRFEHCSKSLV